MRIIFHLGVHKTASTFFQKNVYPFILNSLFLDREKAKEFKKYVLYADDFEFDEKKAYALFIQIRDKYLKEEHNAIIMSDEEYYGNPYLGALDRKRNIDRIINTFSKNVHFLIFLRNQNDLIESLYNQYIKTGGTANPKSFISYQKYPLIFQNNYFFYDKYLKYIINQVSENNLYIHLFEDFRKNKLITIEKICTELNLEISNNIDIKRSINSSLDNNLIGTMRFFNNFIKSPKEPFLLLPILLHLFVKNFLLKVSFFLKSKRNLIHGDEIFMEEIKTSNKELENSFPYLDLIKYDYPL